MHNLQIIDLQHIRGRADILKTWCGGWQWEMGIYLPALQGIWFDFTW